jgi:hypothetical protein
VKNILRGAVLCSAYALSACTTTPTPDLNMYHLRAVNITEYDTAIVATFCGSEAFNNIYKEGPTPQIYPVLKESESYLSFKQGSISKYIPDKHGAWLGNIDFSTLQEYQECGKGKVYPHVYWFEFNVQKILPSKKSNRESYIRAYNEFKQQIIDTHQIELGVVQLPGLAGEALVSEKTSFLKLDDEQYATLLERMD